MIFAKINDEKSAIKALKDARFIFIALGILNIILSFVLMIASIHDKDIIPKEFGNPVIYAIFEGILIVILGITLYKYKSRVLALIAALYSLLTVITRIARYLKF